MSATVSTLPIWKKNSTPAEWLQELAALAIENPERWARIVVIYEEINADGYPIRMRQFSRGIACNNSILGTLVSAQMELFDYMKGCSL